jgi:hypothetical protein
MQKSADAIVAGNREGLNQQEFQVQPGKPANKKSRGDLKSLEVDFGYKYPGRLYLAV